MSRLHFDCRHRYPSGFALEACFEAGDGVTALFGPSGSGKSTALGLIAGLLRPQQGTVRLGDTVLVDTRAGVCLPPERRRLGFVFQDHLLFPHLTVRQNLRYGLRRRPCRAIDFARVVQVLEIGALLDRRPEALSGGQRQRVALGRALLRGPELLLMDEPLTALDEGLKERILTYLERAVAEWRVPTLFVSHDQADVRRLADEVVVLEGGRVVEAGPTVPALDHAVLTQLKHRPSPVNLLRLSDLREVDGHWEGRLGGQRLQLPAGGGYRAGASLSVQFLPQDVTLSRAAVTGLSVRNRLRGMVREVVALPERTFVAVDVGQFLWAEVTADAVRELGVRPGEEITCLIKASAVHPVA
jgi:molybdate transport system ATP-binding protein